jgi:hypothetical protein
MKNLYIYLIKLELMNLLKWNLNNKTIHYN